MGVSCPSYIICGPVCNPFINMSPCLEFEIKTSSLVLCELARCAEIQWCNPLFTAVCFSSLRRQSDRLPNHLRINISMRQALHQSVFGSVSDSAHKVPLKMYNSIKAWRGQVSGGRSVCVQNVVVCQTQEISFGQMRLVFLFLFSPHSLSLHRLTEKSVRIIDF